MLDESVGLQNAALPHSTNLVEGKDRVHRSRSVSFDKNLQVAGAGALALLISAARRTCPEWSMSSAVLQRAATRTRGFEELRMNVVV